jgi:type VI secretion system secreted protein Hcp
MTMSVEIFLKIPGVDGESQTKGKEKQIEIFSYSWGAHNTSGVAHGSGSGAGKVDISSLQLQKSLDASSGKLFLSCCQGKHFDEATLICREAGGSTPVEYLTIKMKQVFVENINWGASQGGGKPSESVSLTFASIAFDYFPQDEKGAKGSKASGGWNIKTNAAVA